MTTAIEPTEVDETEELLIAALMEWRHDPWVYNGEEEVAAMLRRRGITYEYESRFYPLVYTPPGSDTVRWGGFCPDFYLPATAKRPALNVEVTFADRGLSTMPRERRAANLQRLELKRLKIELTRQNYGIETILITRRVFSALRRDPRLLDRLIRKATARHWREQRRRYEERSRLAATG